ASTSLLAVHRSIRHNPPDEHGSDRDSRGSTPPHSSFSAAGPNRMLRVVVDSSRQADIETMASLGHELAHTLEVLAEPNVRTGAGMFDLYRLNGAVRVQDV